MRSEELKGRGSPPAGSSATNHTKEQQGASVDSIVTRHGDERQRAGGKMKYLTIPAAEQQTGVPADLIRHAIETGEIRAKTCTGEIVVTLDDVRDYRAQKLADRGCGECDQ